MPSESAFNHLNTHTWTTFRPGNEITGRDRPGIVLICCAETLHEPGRSNYRVLKIANAKNDAASVALAFFKQQWDCEGGVYAQICLSDDPSLRAQICADLEPLCK